MMITCTALKSPKVSAVNKIFIFYSKMDNKRSIIQEGITLRKMGMKKKDILIKLKAKYGAHKGGF